MTVINKNKKTESFGAKANLLNLDIEEQIKALNELYKGKIKFAMTTDLKIGINYVDSDIVSIELPEANNLDERHLIMISTETVWRRYGDRNLRTIKLPKSLKTLNLKASWLRYIQRLFMWDTTEVLGEEIPENIQLFVVQQSSGAKPKIIKNTI